MENVLHMRKTEKTFSKNCFQMKNKNKILLSKNVLCFGLRLQLTFIMKNIKENRKQKTENITHTRKQKTKTQT